MASQITSITIVYSTVVYSGADKRKHQSPASFAFVWGIDRWPVNSPHKGPVTRKIFLFDDVIMQCDMMQQRLVFCDGWSLVDITGNIANIRVLCLFFRTYICIVPSFYTTISPGTKLCIIFDSANIFHLCVSLYFHNTYTALVLLWRITVRYQDSRCCTLSIVILHVYTHYNIKTVEAIDTIVQMAD